jgi:hypothetical protein
MCGGKIKNTEALAMSVGLTDVQLQNCLYVVCQLSMRFKYNYFCLSPDCFLCRQKGLLITVAGSSCAGKEFHQFEPAVNFLTNQMYQIYL